MSKRVLRAAIVSTPAVAAALSLSPAHAADLFWDTNGTTGGSSANTTAAGTWNATNTNWNTVADGTGATGIWGGAGNNAIFAAGTNATGSYTVTVAGTQALDGMTFEEGTVTLTGGALNFGALQPTFTVAAGTQTINSVVSATGGLNRAGGTAGILVLGGNNTGIAGTTQINTGIVRVTNSGALGTSAVVFGTGPSSTDAALQAARLDLAGSINVTNNVTIRSGGARASQGQLNASSGTATFSGNILMDGMINNEGTGLASVGAASGATLVISGSTINNAPGTSTYISPGVSWPGTWWAKTGAGTVVLRNVTNNTVGSTRVLNGTLVAQSDAAFGPAVVDTTDINQSVLIAALSGNTPTVAFQAPPSSSGFQYLTKRFIRTAGTRGTGGNGEINNLGGDNLFAGDINVNLGTAIGASSGSLELAGHIWGAAATPRTIAKVGAGELIISGTNDGNDGRLATSANPSLGNQEFGINAGTFTIEAGTLRLRNNPTLGGTGSLSGGHANGIGFQVNLNASFILDNSLGVNTARIGNTAPITLAAGEVKLIGNDAASVSQPGGALSVGSYSTITVDQPVNTNGATTTLALGTLNRASRGTALLRGINNSTGFVNLTGTLKGGGASTGSQISILPEVVGDSASTGSGTDFVTIVGTLNGDGTTTGTARPLTAGEYTALVDGTNAPHNTTVTANTAINSNTSINSIKISGGNTVTIAADKILTATSGGLLGVGAGSSAINGGVLTFSTNEQFAPNPDTGIPEWSSTADSEGIITVPTGSTLAIGSALGGGIGITKSGGGTLQLTGTNHYGYKTGAVTTINSGVLEFSVDGNLGQPTVPIAINGGTLRPTGSSTSTRDIQLASPGQNIIDVSTGGVFSTSGNVTGLGLTKRGAGRLDLTNPGSNGYTGGTIIEAGSMGLSASSPTQVQFGTGSITLAGGSLVADTNLTLDKSLISTSGNTTGGFIIPAGVTVQYGSGAASTVGMSGSGNYAINGGGTLRLSNNTGGGMTYTGRLIVNDGSTLVFHPNDNGTPNRIAGIGGTPVQSAQWVVLNDGSRLRFELSSNAGSDYSGSTRGITVNNGGTIDIPGTNHVINTAGIFGTGTVTKDGTGLYSIRTNNSSFSGKWNVAAGAFEIGAPTNNGLSLGTGSGADFITLADGVIFQGTTTGATTTILPNQGITLAGATARIGSKNSVPMNIQGSITGPSVTNLTFGGLGAQPQPATPPGTAVLPAQDNLSGVVTLSGAANNWTGTTTVQAVPSGTAAQGIVRAGVDNALPVGTTLILDPLAANFATFDLGTGATSFNQTVADVTNAGTGGTAAVTNSGTNVKTFTLANATTNAANINYTGALNLAHNGAGTMVLASANNTYTGGTTNLQGTMRVPATGSIPANSNITNNGTFELQKAATVGTVGGTGSLQVGDGAVGINAEAVHVRQAALSVNTGSNLKISASSLAVGVSKVDNVTIASDARLNLNNNKLITLVPAGTATGGIYSGIQGEVQRASNFGAWDQPGLTTDQADALGGLTTIGVATGEQIRGLGPTDTDVFAGQTITGASTVAMYTYAGDANLDGLIDGGDYGIIDNFAQIPGADGYANGDFNYDSVIDGGDYGVIDNNAQAQGAPFFTSGSAGVESAGLAGVTAVPEPASLSVIALGAMSLLGRRRRK